MVKIYGIPRINALGLTGPEKATAKILENITHEEVEISNDNVELDEQKIYDIGIKTYNERSIFVGGDHSITYPLGKAFLQNYWEEDSFMIIFDAHPDLMPPMKEPTHEEFAKGLLKLGWKPENMVFIGLRKIDKVEQKTIDELGIKTFTNEPSEEIINYLINKSKHKRVYLSIDIDVLDPSIVSGVNYPVEKGLSKENFYFLLESIIKRTNVWNVDLVELVPEKDKTGKSLEVTKEILEIVKNLL